MLIDDVFWTGRAHCVLDSLRALCMKHVYLNSVTRSCFVVPKKAKYGDPSLCLTKLELWVHMPMTANHAMTARIKDTR